eukprot:scaffold736_cov254-Pinguiococcus_pyrenoidosus.AAC.20
MPAESSRMGLEINAVRCLGHVVHGGNVRCDRSVEIRVELLAGTSDPFQRSLRRSTSAKIS